MNGVRKPSCADIEAACNQEVPDIIGPGMSVFFCGLFCGINVSLQE